MRTPFDEQGHVMTPLRASPPCHRVILAVDIEGSSMRTNSVRASLRHVMYALLEDCLISSGIREEHRDPFVDRGDGILVLIHPVDEVPKTLLLTRVIPTLEELLRRHAEHCGDRHLRLRAVLHAGEVHYDGRGCFGESLDIAFRLHDSAEVKERFRMARAPLFLVVSDDIHQTVIRHGYEGIDQHAFVPAAYVSVAGQVRHGWIRTKPAGQAAARPDTVANAPRGPS